MPVLAEPVKLLARVENNGCAIGRALITNPEIVIELCPHILHHLEHHLISGALRACRLEQRLLTFQEGENAVELVEPLPE